jgi:hypothetical protein
MPAWQRTEQKQAHMEWEEFAQLWGAVDEDTRSKCSACVARIPGTIGMQLTRRGSDRSVYAFKVNSSEL